MNQHPRLKRHITVVPHSGDVVELRSGVWNSSSITLSDEQGNGTLNRVLRMLNGGTSEHDIARICGVDPSEIESLVASLQRINLIEYEPTTALEAYLDASIRALRPSSNARPHQRRIVLLGDDRLCTELEQILRVSLPTLDVNAELREGIVRLLQEAPDSWLYDGQEFASRTSIFDQWQDSFVIFIATTINPHHFTVMNRIAVKQKIPWMHAALDGPFLLVGPLFVPPSSACYECLDTRVLMNLRDTASYLRYKEFLTQARGEPTQLDVFAPIQQLLVSLTSLEVLTYLSCSSSLLVGKMLSVYLPTMEFVYHDVLRLAACDGCGSVAERDDVELYFSLRKLFSESK